MTRAWPLLILTDGLRRAGLGGVGWNGAFPLAKGGGSVLVAVRVLDAAWIECLLDRSARATARSDAESARGGLTDPASSAVDHDTGHRPYHSAEDKRVDVNLLGYDRFPWRVLGRRALMPGRRILMPPIMEVWWRDRTASGALHLQEDRGPGSA